eukprot:Sdes_comp16221_c0_seq1m5502
MRITNGQQTQLANVIKKHHREARQKYVEIKEKLCQVMSKSTQVVDLNLEEIASRQVWEELVTSSDKLEEYAYAMKELSCEHWNKKSNGRIDWCTEKALYYFEAGELEKRIEKDVKRKEFIKQLENSQVEKICSRLTPVFDSENSTLSVHQRDFSCPYKLLDVGSCFNPFHYLYSDIFQVSAIDLYPADSSVIQCDLLNLDVVSNSEALLNPKTPAFVGVSESYSVIIFSLLLSYFPSPFQRWIACLKAYQ